jgi:hypothetical protein
VDTDPCVHTAGPCNTLARCVNGQSSSCHLMNWQCCQRGFPSAFATADAAGPTVATAALNCSCVTRHLLHQPMTSMGLVTSTCARSCAVSFVASVLKESAPSACLPRLRGRHAYDDQWRPPYWHAAGLAQRISVWLTNSTR